jgi:hypothetical protein
MALPMAHAARTPEELPLGGTRRFARVLLIAAAVFTIVVASLSLVLWRALPRSSQGDWSERGVSLGMSESQVRNSFVDAAAGEWTQTTACGGPSLEWTRKKPGVPTRWARFEMHDGLVAAMRVHSDGQAGAPRARQGAFAVRRDRLYDGGTATTILARGVPTYAAEAEQIARLATGSTVAGR